MTHGVKLIGLGKKTLKKQRPLLYQMIKRHGIAQ